MEQAKQHCKVVYTGNPDCDHVSGKIKFASGMVTFVSTNIATFGLTAFHVYKWARTQGHLHSIEDDNKGLKLERFESIACFTKPDLASFKVIDPTGQMMPYCGIIPFKAASWPPVPVTVGDSVFIYGAPSKTFKIDTKEKEANFGDIHLNFKVTNIEFDNVAIEAPDEVGFLEWREGHKEEDYSVIGCSGTGVFAFRGENKMTLELVGILTTDLTLERKPGVKIKATFAPIGLVNADGSIIGTDMVHI